MSTTYHVIGNNKKAPFTLKIHRGDGMALLAMNWRSGKPPMNFVGFAIEVCEPNGTQFRPLKNRIGFPGDRVNASDKPIESTQAPFQKFRWVHFPRDADKPGAFTYRVTPMFMDDQRNLFSGEAQTAAIPLQRETIPNKLNVAFTRGYVSSQAFTIKYAPDRDISGLIPDKSTDGLTFTPTHPKAAEALTWMGFEARHAILQLLDEAIARNAEVRVIAYDLNLPEVLSRLEQIGPRLKIIIDDSDHHKDPTSPETIAATRLQQSAGPQHVFRQHLGNLQHHKSIAVRGPGINKVVYGSTNFTWRGFYVQSNNAVIVNSASAADDFFTFFDLYASAKGAKAFKACEAATGWHSLGIPGLKAQVGYSPRWDVNDLLAKVGKDIGKAKSNIFFSLAFLGQMTKGPVGPALGKKLQSKNVFTLGIADKRVGAENLGVTVISPNNQRRLVRASALTGDVPPPFSTEPTGLSGKSGAHTGTRMHHKFVVIDFDTPDARVYLGSHNFSEVAEYKNGENLLCIKDRRVATSYMIEALRMYDHYRFRTVQEEKKGKTGKVLELQLPPSSPDEKPWWHRDWADPLRKQDRELFA